MTSTELELDTLPYPDPHAEIRLGPWRHLPEEWIRLRHAVSRTPVRDQEAAACELAVLSGIQPGSGSSSTTIWKAVDSIAAQRMKQLLEVICGGSFDVHRLIAGQTRPHVSYVLVCDQPLPAGADYAIAKERRRLDAGDRWLRGAFEPELLARALWSATVLAAPPMVSLKTRAPLWRLASRQDAAALDAAGRYLGLRLGRIERRVKLWRVCLDEDMPSAMGSLHRALLSR